eukprot:403349798
MIDLYGKSVQLTYKGQETYKSMVGASISFIIICTLFSYLVFKINVLFTKNDTKLAKKSFFLDLDSDDLKEMDIGEGGFDFSFGMNNDLDPKYGTFVVNQVEVVYDPATNKGVKYRTPIAFAKCEDKYFNFPNQEKVKLYGIQRYLCPTKKQYMLKGNYYSKQFKYVEIRLRRCDYAAKNNTCKTQQEINDYFAGEKFSIAIVNQYFDANNYTQPIQKFIDDAMYFEMEPNVWKGSNIYIQQNQAQYQDKLLSFSDDKAVFYSTVNFREYQDSQAPNDPVIATYYIRLDNQYEVYERRVYGISDLLGDIGGFKESLIMIGMLMVGFVQEKLFVSSILKHIYQIESSKAINSDEDSKSQDNTSKHYSDTELGDNQSSKSRSNSVKTIRMQTSVTDETQKPKSEKSTKMKRNDFKLKKMEERIQSEKVADYFEKNATNLSQKEKENLTSTLLRRLRFQYTLKDIFEFIFRCGCFMKKKNMILKKSMRKHALFVKGEDKLQDELDCVTLLKSIRSLKLLIQVFLNENQKMFMKFQRKMVLDSESSSSDSDRNDQDTVKLFESKNYALRATIRNKIRSSVDEITTQSELKNIDKRLLKGIFLKRLKEKRKAQAMIGLQNYFRHLITGDRQGTNNLGTGENNITSAPYSQIPSLSLLINQRHSEKVSSPNLKVNNQMIRKTSSLKLDASPIQSQLQQINESIDSPQINKKYVNKPRISSTQIHQHERNQIYSEDQEQTQTFQNMQFNFKSQNNKDQGAFKNKIQSNYMGGFENSYLDESKDYLQEEEMILNEFKKR